MFSSDRNRERTDRPKWEVLLNLTCELPQQEGQPQLSSAQLIVLTHLASLKKIIQILPPTTLLLLPLTLIANVRSTFPSMLPSPLSQFSKSNANPIAGSREASSILNVTHN